MEVYRERSRKYKCSRRVEGWIGDMDMSTEEGGEGIVRGISKGENEREPERKVNCQKKHKRERK